MNVLWLQHLNNKTQEKILCSNGNPVRNNWNLDYESNFQQKITLVTAKTPQLTAFVTCYKANDFVLWTWRKKKCGMNDIYYMRNYIQVLTVWQLKLPKKWLENVVIYSKPFRFIVITSQNRRMKSQVENQEKQQNFFLDQRLRTDAQCFLLILLKKSRYFATTSVFFFVFVNNV